MFPEPKPNPLIRQAIEERKVLRFFYDGGFRTVEPFVHGINTAEHLALRAFQTSGHSESHSQGWKMFLAAEISKLSITDVNFDGRRPHYNPKDKAFVKIFCFVPKVL